jgi:hypothetical protein
MERANIFSADGKPALTTDLQPGMQVTVQYAERGNRWYISKVMVAEPRNNTVVGAPTNVDRALTQKAAKDGDITTQPGSKAAVDNDITTQPGSKAAIDNDITTQPGSNNATSGRAPLHRRGP